jgi:RNA polymerase sigma-70 factor (ECF subfamily)
VDNETNREIDVASEGCFVELYLRHQRSIYAFIVQLVQNYDESEDLLQKTGLVLWRKFGQFEPGTDFLAWARQIAKYEVQDYLKAKRRNRVCFSTDTVEMLAESVDRDALAADLRHDALTKCLAELRTVDRELVARCYATGASIRGVAESLGRSIDGAYQSLRRIRHALLQCIERRLAAEERL